MRLRYHTIEPHLYMLPLIFICYHEPLSSVPAKLGLGSRFHFLRGSLVLPAGNSRLDVAAPNTAEYLLRGDVQRNSARDIYNIHKYICMSNIFLENSKCKIKIKKLIDGFRWIFLVKSKRL